MRLRIKRPVEMPLLTAMEQYVGEQVLPFHTPGHKMGRGAPQSMRRYLGRAALSLDLTYIPGLGDLFETAGPIRKAQENAASLYGAKASYFLVNGTTGGIYAMLLATVGPGEKIILPRNAHRSALGGLILSGAMPVFVQPAIDAAFQMAMNVSAEAMESTILDNPDAKAILLVNPTYYGVTADLKRIVDFAHRQGMVVLIDEAHGPHFPFSTALPLDGLAAGADLVVQSTHKILGALSQASLLHCNGERINRLRLESMLQLVQSSSPNYILLASLEAAVAQMAERGPELVEKTIMLAERARRQLRSVPGLECLEGKQMGVPGSFALDVTKLTVSVRHLRMNAKTAEDWLRRVGKVQAELSEGRNLLFLITLGDNRTSLKRLVDALTALAGEENLRQLPETEVSAVIPDLSTSVAISPREAIFGSQTRVDFSRSAGRICAEAIISYPPGIPNLLPGERITSDIIKYCKSLQRQGSVILGPEDPSLATIGVVA
jgi:arginine decarboxylase